MLSHTASVGSSDSVGDFSRFLFSQLILQPTHPLSAGLSSASSNLHRGGRSVRRFGRLTICFGGRQALILDLVGGETFWIHHQNSHQNLAIYYPSIIIYSWFPVPKIHTLPGLEDDFPLKIRTMFRVELLIEAAGYSQ